MEKPQIKAPGLRVRPRKGGWALYWIPKDEAVKAGYPSGTVNLSYLYDGTDTGRDEVILRCHKLQTEMLMWLDGFRRERAGYDGTISSILRMYEQHPDSGFQRLKPGSRHPYVIYLARLHAHVGGRLVRAVTAYDVRQWWKVWADVDVLGRPTKIAAGAMAATVLKAAVKWAAICGVADAKAFYADLALLEFPKPKPRRAVASAADVAKARQAAHRRGSASRALAYAIQFETALRQWDVIGQWHPLDAPVISDVTGPLGKWVGLTWRHIGPDLVLRYTPSKTEDTSEAEIVVDLKLCPMVLEEIAAIAPERRVGPVVVNEYTRLPYGYATFKDGWRADFRAAGLPANLWGRDLRASAVTEGRSGGAATDDAAKVAGHTKSKTTAKVYDREQLEAQRRFQAARIKVRGGGNE